MKRLPAIALGGVVVLGLTAILFALPRLKGTGPALLPPPALPGEPTRPSDLPAGEPAGNQTGLPLSLPEGLSAFIFAQNVPGARVLATGPEGDLYVSQTSQGTILAIREENGEEVERRTVVSGLRRPHGLVFDWREPHMLYVAEEHRIVRLDTSDPDAVPQHVIDLPSGSGHFTRTIRFGPDERLYVSVGSSCNVCHEQDERRAGLWSLNADGSDFRQVARGLRNSVFFDWEPLYGELWATDMGRDHLGDDLPPDEINVIDWEGEDAQNFGWPICYGQNVHDTAFDRNTYVRNPCMEPFETPSHVDLPAHSSPLGIAFMPEEGWPEDWWYDAVVAYHGSWNRSEPTGYKLVRVVRDHTGAVQGVEDLVTGWLQGSRAHGRPVDVLVRPGGTMYVSDDHAGVIYRFVWEGARPGDGTETFPPEEPTVPAQTPPFSSNQVRLDAFGIGDVLTSPATLRGQARGTMFFEANFPVYILDADGTELGVGIAQADGEWMTSEFVPFSVPLTFTRPTGEYGLLRFVRDNPSGLPEFDLTVDVPVRFGE